MAKATPFAKFVKISAGYYEARYSHGFTAQVFKTPDGDWSYTFWQGGQLKLTGARFARKKIAEAQAEYEADQITVPVVNMMSGKEFQEAITTPYYCSPSSETYWSS